MAQEIEKKEINIKALNSKNEIIINKAVDTTKKDTLIKSPSALEGIVGYKAKQYVKMKNVILE